MEDGDPGHHGILALSHAVEDCSADIVCVTAPLPNTVEKNVWEMPKEPVCATPSCVQLVRFNIASLIRIKLKRKFLL